MNTGISILIPLYNGIEFLEETLNSVVSQTHTTWEVIVGINGHPNDSDVEKQAVKLLEKYHEFDMKVIYYNTRGKSETLNNMINDIKYDYIALLDADDLWLPEKLEKQIPLLKSYDVVGTNCQYFGDKTGFPGVPFGNLKNVNFFSTNPIINSSVIIHKQNAKWDKDELRGIEDYDLWFRLHFEGKSFYNIEDVLCRHRIHKSSSFNNGNDNYVNELRQKWWGVFYQNRIEK
jgi:glycosyltransferase involved in cell wall biosynthesis